MRFRRMFLILVLSVFAITLIFSVFHHYLLKNSKNASDILLKHWTSAERTKHSNHERPVFYIAVVACGQRLRETLTMIKSALLFNFSKDLVHFLVFAEENLQSSFQEKLEDWRKLLPMEFSFELLPLRFPPGTGAEWRNLFKPCAAQRLFMPSIANSSVDALLYVDTDILFLSPVSDIWQFFRRFNDTQLAALAPEHEDEHIGWYNRFARHPYYGHLGVNSGVMLMNLTRMRTFGWETHVLPIYKEYKLKLTWGDQDIINILFYYNPEKLYIMPCEYNYRPDHCMYMSVCNASSEGIKVMHGNRGYFHSNKQPLFRIIYEAVENFQLGTDPYKNFYLPLQTILTDSVVVDSNCGKVSKESMQVASKLFQNYIYES